MIVAAIPLSLLGCGTFRTEFRLEDPEQFYPGTFRVLSEQLRGAARIEAPPAGVLVLFREGRTVYSATWGRHRPGGSRVHQDSRFDVASLTKLMAAGPLLHQLPEGVRVLARRGGLDDEQEYPILLDWASRGAIGDPPFPISEPATASVHQYSNTSFYLAGVQRRLSSAEEELLGEWWAPADLVSTTFRPPIDDCVTSGNAPDGAKLQGVPFDPLAHATLFAGRLPLHSGLSSSPSDVMLFARALLAPPTAKWGTFADRCFTMLPPLVDRETGRPIHISAGGLLSATDPPFGRIDATPGRFVYATGYTGCLLWIDRETATIVVLLTNASANDSLMEFEELSAEVISSVIRGTVR